jgi:hypothetical protein
MHVTCSLRVRGVNHGQDSEISGDRAFAVPERETWKDVQVLSILLRLTRSSERVENGASQASKIRTKYEG